MGRDARVQRRRMQIVEAAAAVFTRKGYAGTVIADVAREAAIGKGTVYEYFDSKESLFFGVFEWLIAKTEASATVRIDAMGGSAADRLMAFSTAITGIWNEMRDYYPLTLEFWAASASSGGRARFKQVFRQGYSDLRRMVAAILAEGIRNKDFRGDVDTHAVAAVLVGAWDALFLQAWFDDDFDPTEMARRALADFLQGLLPRGGAPD